MLCSKHNKCLDSQDLTTILDLLKLGFSRQFFSETLLKSVIKVTLNLKILKINKRVKYV